MSGISDLKEALGAANVTMRYGDGGRTQIVTVDGMEYELPGYLSTHDIADAIAKARETKA